MYKYKLLTLDEAARGLLVSICTIKRYLKSGKLIGIKLPNSHWRVLESSYVEFIEKNMSSNNGRS